MGWLRKKGKQLGKLFKKVGKKLKKGLGKVAKAFGKLGPLGSIALSFILPGIGSQLMSMFQGTWIGTIADGIVRGVNFVKDGIGQVFSNVTGAIERGMNVVSKDMGKGNFGTRFRNWASDITGGRIGKSTIEIEKAAVDLGLDPEAVLEALESGLTTREEILGRKLTDDGFKFKDKAAQKIIENKKLVDASQGPKERKAFLDNLSNPDVNLRDAIKNSSEAQTYKKIESLRMAGSSINQAEDAYEQQVEYYKNLKSDYFKQQASYQLSAVEQQNYSQVQDMPTFVDFSKFNPQQDPSSQYLMARGIQGNVNPMDVGGYGFNYEAFLRAQLGENYNA